MGLIHLDAGVIIGLLDASDAHHAAAREALGDALGGGNKLAMSASAFAECLVGPSSRGPDAVGVVLGLVERVPISIFSLDGEVAKTAANLRARHPPLRLPDALVIATAVEDEADQLVTTDRRWPSAKSMQVKVLIKVL